MCIASFIKPHLILNSWCNLQIIQTQIVSSDPPPIHGSLQDLSIGITKPNVINSMFSIEDQAHPAHDGPSHGIKFDPNACRYLSGHNVSEDQAALAPEGAVRVVFVLALLYAVSPGGLPVPAGVGLHHLLAGVAALALVELRPVAGPAVAGQVLGPGGRGRCGVLPDHLASLDRVLLQVGTRVVLRTHVGVGNRQQSAGHVVKGQVHVQADTRRR